jgi:hypothetical protein
LVKRPKVSLVMLMAIVGTAAVDVSLGSDLTAYRPFLLVGVAPGTVAVEVGLLMLVVSRGRARAFWAGFVMAGALAAASYLWSMMYGHSMYITVTKGRLTCSWWAPGPLGSPWNGLANFWYAYGLLATKCLECLLYLSRIRVRWWDSQLNVLVVSALILFLPQLLIAMLGGLLSLVLARMVGIRERRRSTATISG